MRRLLLLMIFAALMATMACEAAEGKGKKKMRHHHHHPQPTGWVDYPSYQGAGGDIYVAYGDSITHGYGSTLPYPSLLTYYREQDSAKGISLYNNGVNGYWSEQLVNLLETSQAKQGNQQARYVTVSIGYNDMTAAKVLYLQGLCGGDDGEQCYRDAVARFKSNWDKILSNLTSNCSPEGTSIVVATQYEALVAEGKVTYTRPPRSDHEVHKQYTEEINAHITSTAQAEGIPVADLHTLFNGPTHDDPIPWTWLYDAAHPNATGDINIADEFRKHGTEVNCRGGNV